MLDKEKIVDVLKQVYDPEIPVNIYDLGLIYQIETEENRISIDMTLTSEHCPSAAQIPETIRVRLEEAFPGSGVHVRVVWDPAWSPERISDEGKKKLNLL